MDSDDGADDMDDNDNNDVEDDDYIVEDENEGTELDDTITSRYIQFISSYCISLYNPSGDFVQSKYKTMSMALSTVYVEQLVHHFPSNSLHPGGCNIIKL